MFKKEDALQSITTLFTDHPRSIGETYWQHLRYAIVKGVVLTVAGLCLIIHSIFPFLFVNTASNVVTKIYTTLQQRKNSGK